MAVLARGTITVSVNNDLVYKGELSAPPANPEINWYYYNTTNGITYVYDGENWAMMVQDGRSLLDQSNQYYLHDSKTTPPPDDAEWSDESIEPSSAGYVWIRTKLTWSAEPLITYTDARWSEWEQNLDGLTFSSVNLLDGSADVVCLSSPVAYDFGKRYMENGETYTFRIDDSDVEYALNTNGKYYPQLYIWTYNVWSNLRIFDIKDNNKFSFVWNKPSGEYDIQLYSHTSGADVSGQVFKEAMLVKGNKIDQAYSKSLTDQYKDTYTPYRQTIEDSYQTLKKQVAGLLTNSYISDANAIALDGDSGYLDQYYTSLIDKLDNIVGTDAWLSEFNDAYDSFSTTATTLKASIETAKAQIETSRNQRISVTEWVNSFGAAVESDGAIVGDMLAIKREDDTISTLLTNDDDEIPDIAVGIGDYTDDDVESLKAAAKTAPFAVFSNGLVRQASIQRKYITLTQQNQHIYLANNRLLIDPMEGYNYIFSYQPTGGIVVDLPEMTNADSGTVVRIINMSGEPFILTNGQIWNNNQALPVSIRVTDVMAEYELEYIVKQDRSGALLYTGAWTIKRQVYEAGWID